MRWRYGLTFDFFAALRGGDSLNGRGYRTRICQSQMHLSPLIPSLKSLLSAKVFLQEPIFLLRKSLKDHPKGHFSNGLALSIFLSFYLGNSENAGVMYPFCPILGP